jgi:hypothetical protein
MGLLLFAAATVWVGSRLTTLGAPMSEPAREGLGQSRVSVQAQSSPALEVGSRSNSDPQIVRDRHRGPSRIMIGGVEGTQYWEDDVRIVTYSDGRIFLRGRFREGLEEGVHESWRPDGSLSASVTWVAGARNGPSVYYSATGATLSRGSYLHGYMSGPWDTYDAAGRRESSGSYEVGLGGDGTPREQLRVGRWLFWLPDGRLDMELSGFYEADKRVRGL